jgi:hypothetical protein
MRSRRGVLRRAASILPVVLTLVAAPPGMQVAAAAIANVAISSGGGNGVGLITSPGLGCGAGGSGAYRQYQLQAPLASGTFSSLAGSMVSTIEVHTDPALATVSGGQNSFLLTANSAATLENDRGFVPLVLTSSGGASGIGTCPQATMTFDGTKVVGSGTWSVGTAVGAYRNTTGTGTFTLNATLLPGATNPWTLALNGSLSVLQPSLGVKVASTFWGNLGLDYARRIVSVTYQISNNGPGDSFNEVLVNTTSSTAGVTPLGPIPQSLGDIPAGQSTQVTVRYQLGLTQPCSLVILACTFQTSVTVNQHDALDVVKTQTGSATVTAPATPPPL